MAGKVTIKIDNKRNNGEELHALLTADSATQLTGIELNKSTKLADIQGNTISMDTVKSGRLYIGCGELKGAPLPDGDQYYGWVEFSCLEADPVVWINLTNVDVLGLPLALAGIADDGIKWTLGYQKSVNDIRAIMTKDALTTTDKSAVINCDPKKSGKTPLTKIVAPNIIPGSYATFDNYITELASSNARLIITSDTPDGGQAKVFTGSFKAAQTAEDVLIHLESGSDTLEVQKGQFSSDIIYRCDGGTLIYNKKTLPQNRTDQTDPHGDAKEQTITNSVFRNLLIGIQEGYFSTSGKNYSANFPYLEPFKSKQGSAFAKILHEHSSSYGFPYADSNLKVLVTSKLNEVITLTIMGDDDVTPTEGEIPVTNNAPLSGDYSFGIGDQSSDLGVISIGNCRYVATKGGAYGGFLPTLDEWTEMHFSKPNKSIWIKTSGTGFVSGNNCFRQGAKPAPGAKDDRAVVSPDWQDKKMVLGAFIDWNNDASTPAKPEDPPAHTLQPPAAK